MPARRSDTMLTMQGIFSGHGPVFTHFEAAKPPTGGAYRPLWQPLTDVFEYNAHIVVRMELAGVRAEDIQIVLDNARLLTISGVRRNPCRGRRPSCYYQMESNYGAFQRSIQLPKPVDAEGAQAGFDGGFLDVALPIAEVQQEPVRFVVSII